MSRMKSRFVTVLVGLVAILALGGLTASSGVAGTATTSDQYSKLKKQRAKQIKKCKKAVRKARKTRNAKRIRKAKKKSRACVRRAKKTYKKRMKPLAPQRTHAATYKARGSVGDAYVTGAKPNTSLMLVNKKERVIRTGKTDQFGAKIFYDVPPGANYSVRTRVNKKRVLGTKKFPVLKPDDNPDQSFYKSKERELKPGLNYVTMRDGVELAMTVRLPPGKKLSDGPFPAMIEHSGYQTAAPHDMLDSILAGMAGTGTNDPLAPITSTAVGGLIGQQMGFAVVSVQMRGSGCSGGAFDLFGLPTTYDGYDMIETVAAQDWVKGKVGMGGISFSGISQLFAAGTQPPHLAAISPMSVTDDIYQGTGFPGGIFNNGFAYSWITERADDAKPAPEFGQPWAKVMATTGDPEVTDPVLRESQKQHCLDNQQLRLQTRDYNKEIENNPFRTPLLFDSRAPGAWMKRIDVPVFFIGQFQDEQTGAHFPEALTALQGKKDVWITLQNGVHVDSLGPSAITQWVEFMQLFVADKVPSMPPLLSGLSSTLYAELADAGALPIQESALAGMPNAEAALTEYRKNPRVRIMLDNGAAVPGDPGAIGAKWETHFDDWPIKSLKPTTWYLGPNGELTETKPAEGQASYVSDPKARPARTLGANAQGDSWLAQPPYNWQPVADGKGLGWTSAAMPQDTFIAGPSSLDVYLKSNKTDTDLQVTMTEVRPDGKETYVQNGWLRASHRKLDEKLSTENNPVQTHLVGDSQPLEVGKFNLARIQIFPVAHVFRAGSKIRINLQAPGGDRTIWDFDTIEKGDTQNTVGIGGAIPSKLVLPVIPGQTSQGNPLPGPTDLRGQPSREYVPASNGG